MNKKLLILTSLIFILGSFVFVNASITSSGVGVEKSVEINIQKGWNLVLGFDTDLIAADSGIEKEDILISYIYIPDKNKYMVYDVDNSNSEFGKYVSTLSNDEIKYIEMSPIWIYSEESGSIKYNRGELSDYSDVTLKTGWNFITITPEMTGKTINEIKGTCNIEKNYWWSPNEQSWELWNDQIFRFPENAGSGFILKVSSDCTLGTSSTSGTITAPPAMPTGNSGNCTDTDGGTVIDTKGSVTYNGETKEDNCADSTSVIEYDCDWDNGNIARVNTFDCSDVEGFSSCQNGRCI